MIDHITIRVSDLAKSAKFYESALSVIGYKKIKGDFDDAAAYETTDTNGVRGSVWLIQAGKDEKVTTNIHVAFRVSSIEVIKKFYECALAAGGKDNGAPGKCPEYGEDYYGGFVFDPDGNNIEAVTYLR